MPGVHRYRAGLCGTAVYSLRSSRINATEETTMQRGLQELGALIANAGIDDEPGPVRTAIDQGIRASLLCTLFGIEREPWVWPFPAQAGANAQGAPEMLAGDRKSGG